jgi:hypothetical protein
LTNWIEGELVAVLRDSSKPGVLVSDHTTGPAD